MKGLLAFSLSAGLLLLVNSCTSHCCKEGGCSVTKPVTRTAVAKTVAADDQEVIKTVGGKQYVVMGSDAGKAGDMRTVYFGTAKDSLTEETKATLRHNAEWMKKNPRAKVLAEGCYDSRGSVEYNVPLSQRRADNVKKYMVEQGVSADRIKTTSVGRELPPEKDQSEVSWAKNRRVNFVLID